MSPDPKKIMVTGSGTSEGLSVALATPEFPKIRDNVHNNKTFFTPAPPLTVLWFCLSSMC